jgi:hypothetical protein
MQEKTHTKLKIDLHEKQRLAFYSRATEILFGGSAGPGKSLLMRISAVRWCEMIPGCQVYLFRRTYPDLRDNHLRGPTSLKMLLAGRLASGEVAYNKTENEFVWKKTNSRIRLCHCQNEDDVENYQGAEIHVLLIDELTHFSEYQYKFLRSRVRCVGIEIPEKFKSYFPRVETASNPGSLGHSWVKKMFVSQTPMEIVKTRPVDGGMLRQYIPARIADNPTMMKEDPTYLDRLNGLGSEQLVKAMRDGDWDIFAGQYFTDFSRDIHVLPRDFKIEPWWQKFCGYDHGFNHPFVFGAYAVDGDGNVIKFAECGDTNKKPDEIIKAIRDCFPEIKSETIWAGHDCWTRQRDGGPAVVEHFHNAGLNFVQAKIDRKAGAAQMRHYLDWRKDDNGIVIKKPRLYFKENCWRSIRQIPAMVIDDRDVEDVLKVDASDGDVWAGDDGYDETRYALMSRPPLGSKEPPRPAEQFSINWYKKKMHEQENMRRY